MIVTLLRRGQFELLHAQPVDENNRRILSQRLRRDHIHVLHFQQGLVRDRPVPPVHESIHLLPQSLLDGRVKGQLVGDVAHQRGGRVETGEEKDERLGRDVVDGHPIIDRGDRPPILLVPSLHQKVNHVRPDYPPLVPRSHRLAYHSVEEGGGSPRKERQSRHPGQTRIHTEQHELEQSEYTAEIGRVRSFRVELVVPVLHRVHAYPESDGRYHVVRVPRERVLRLYRARELGMIVKITDELLGTIGNEVEHEPHLAGRERGAQRVPHLPPSVPLQ